MDQNSNEFLTKDKLTDDNSENGAHVLETDIEKVEEKIIIPELNEHNFSDFIFLRKDQIDILTNNHSEAYLFGRNKEESELSAYEMQALLVFLFMKNNLKPGFKILQIGDVNTSLLDKMKDYYECWIIRDVNELSKDFKDINIVCYNYGDRKFEHDYSYFDFVYSLSGLDRFKYPHSPEKFDRILENIMNLANWGAYFLNTFLVTRWNDHELASDLIYYFYKQYFFPLNVINDFVNPLDALNSEVLLDFEMNETDIFRNSFPKATSGTLKYYTYNILHKKNHLGIASRTADNAEYYQKKNPSFIFHHIVKCGGTSVLYALDSWFNMQFYDYHPDENKKHYNTYKVNTHLLTSDSCVSGHFMYEGTFLHQRYPEIYYRKDQIKTFTFVRDPLKFRISFYYYTKNKGGHDLPLTKFLNSDKNLLASLIPCDENNYREVMDRYIFVGICERMQESLDKLAKILNKRRVRIDNVNKSEKDDQLSEINEEFIEKFKENNKLDYLIYNYCLEKFNRIS